MPKSVLRAVLGRMQFTLHATRRTPHGTSRLMQAISTWLVSTRNVPRPGTVGMRGSMVIRSGPCANGAHLVPVPRLAQTEYTLSSVLRPPGPHRRLPFAAVDAFDFSFLVSAPTDDGSFRVVSGGTGCGDYETDLSGLVEVPSTGGWANYADLPM